jgi:LmbE family N-acetylglucosaminyl deacetylase
MCVFAHPDDETLGCGGTLARYAREGVEITLVTATRGERGWGGDEKDFPGLAELGKIREAELRAAAEVLGIQKIAFLDYIDGDLDKADPAEAMARIEEQIRQERPQVVITFEPLGNYGHPDHIAISQFTAGAIVAAAAGNSMGGAPSHRVSKLYYMLDTEPLVDMYIAMMGETITFDVDGERRQHVRYPSWGPTTCIDVADFWPLTMKAIACHRTQTKEMMKVLGEAPVRFPEKTWWGEQTFYRAYSLVNGGRKLETDLFAGLR